MKLTKEQIYHIEIERNGSKIKISKSTNDIDKYNIHISYNGNIDERISFFNINLNSRDMKNLISGLNQLVKLEEESNE